MRQAIVTKYFGPTNTRGSRIKATAQAGSVVVPWDHSLGIDENHDRAANALLKKLGWHETIRTASLCGGQLPDGTYAFVIVDRGAK